MSENIGLNIVGVNKYLLDEYVYVTLVTLLEMISQTSYYSYFQHSLFSKTKCEFFLNSLILFDFLPPEFCHDCFLIIQVSAQCHYLQGTVLDRSPQVIL